MRDDKDVGLVLNTHYIGEVERVSRGRGDVRGPGARQEARHGQLPRRLDHRRLARRGRLGVRSPKARRRRVLRRGGSTRQAK